MEACGICSAESFRNGFDSHRQASKSRLGFKQGDKENDTNKRTKK